MAQVPYTGENPRELMMAVKEGNECEAMVLAFPYVWGCKCWGFGDEGLEV